jgi:hypothetical protein
MSKSDQLDRAAAVEQIKQMLSADFNIEVDPADPSRVLLASKYPAGHQGSRWTYRIHIDEFAAATLVTWGDLASLMYPHRVFVPGEGVTPPPETDLADRT